MPTQEMARCYRCDKRVGLTVDGRYYRHHYSHRQGMPAVCIYSGRHHNRHTASFRVTSRDRRGIGTEWVARCLCGAVFPGPTHQVVHAMWTAHVADPENTTPGGPVLDAQDHHPSLGASDV